MRVIESVEHRLFDWPGIRQIFHIVRKREYRERCREEHTYGITSLTQEEAGAKRLPALNRNYWHIENMLHHAGDMTLREDQSRIRHQAKSRILCAVRNTVIILAYLPVFSSVMEAIETFSDQRKKALQLVDSGRTELIWNWPRTLRKYFADFHDSRHIFMNPLIYSRNKSAQGQNKRCLIYGNNSINNFIAAWQLYNFLS